MSSAPVESIDTLRSEELLEEVVVFSSVKENGLINQQPISVSVLGKQQLNDLHITSLKGVSTLAPNLFIPEYGSRLTSAFYIRGIGSRINTPAVGLYVDNIPYIDKSAFDFNFCDIERVDVMRGPQGTLYGRNTMGGLVRVFTKNPFYYTGTEAHLGFATGDNHRNIALTHYHQTGEQFAFSAGGYYEDGDGFFKNVTTGEKADGIQSTGARFRAIYRSSKRLSFDLTANYDYSDENAYPYFHDGVISNNREHSYRRHLANLGLNAEYHADQWQMNAITSYQYINDRMFLDQDFTAPDIYTLEQKQRVHTLNEEVTIKNFGNSFWKGISGINVMYQALDTDGPVNFMEEGVSSLIEGNINGVFARLKQDYPKMPNMSIALQQRQFEVSSQMNTPQFSAALFHQSTLTLDRFDLTLGARLEYNSRKLDYLSGTDILYDFSIAMAPGKSIDYKDLVAKPLRDGKLKDHDLLFLPKATLQYNHSLGSLYASMSKGYRSGGYNIQMFSDIIQGDMRGEMMTGINEASKGMMERFVDMETMTAKEDVSTVTYKPEYSWNYEIGTHLNLTSLCLDAALFYSRIYDQQIAQFAPSGLGRMMVNAGESESYGTEVSVIYRPISSLVLSGNYGYTHATFLKYEDGKGNDYADKYVPFVPMHNVALDAAYTWKIGQNKNYSERKLHSITLGANWTGTGRIYWTENNDASQGFYTLLGARLSFEMARWSVTLWGKNLTDRQYNTFYFVSAGKDFEQHSKPLQIGIDFHLNF